MRGVAVIAILLLSGCVLVPNGWTLKPKPVTGATESSLAHEASLAGPANAVSVKTVIEHRPLPDDLTRPCAMYPLAKRTVEAVAQAASERHKSLLECNLRLKKIRELTHETD